MRKCCELMNCITFYLDKAERGELYLRRDDIHCAGSTIMEHPSIIGDESAWPILSSSRPYESNPDKVPQLQWIYENASDMITVSVRCRCFMAKFMDLEPKLL